MWVSLGKGMTLEESTTAEALLEIVTAKSYLTALQAGGNKSSVEEGSGHESNLE